MSDEPYIKLVETFVNAANATSEQRDDQGTCYYLAQAADAANEIEDDISRRTAWSDVAKGAVDMQYPELSQPLARKLIRLDRKLGYTTWVLTDVLSYGSSLLLTRQHLEAEDVFLQVLDLALELESWQHAAAASSNYAAAIAQRGAMEEAQNRLESSLEYLDRQPSLDTEIRTRATLIEVRYARGEPPAMCFKMARALLNEHKTKITRVYRVILQRVLDQVLKSYFANNPNLQPLTWVGEHFPELMEATDD